MRKLATIQKVLAVKPIEGADFVERLAVLGWTLVSQKGNFQPGDLCIYFEVDSQLPNTEDFDFMLQGLSEEDRTNPDKVKRALRLRAKKIRKIVSQGLALPVKDFMHLLPKPFKLGDDVTEVLGVTKYEPPEESFPREVEGPFPFQVPKTDETRIQAIPSLLEELRGLECYSSVKMDGQSLTFAKLLDTEGNVAHKVCTRNQAIKPIEGNVHWKMAAELDIFNKLPTNFALQGEFVGPGVNGNRLGLNKHQFFAFQIWDVTNQRYLDFAEFKAKCQEWNITTVPIENESFILNQTVEELLELSNGKYQNNFPREGLVIRSVKDAASDTLNLYGADTKNRVSFKVINPEYLVKIKD